MLVGINKGNKNVLNYINTSDYRQKTYKKQKKVKQLITKWLLSFKKCYILGS